MSFHLQKKNTKKNCHGNVYFHAINEDMACIVIMPDEPRFLQIYSTILAAILVIYRSLSFIFSVLYEMKIFIVEKWWVFLMLPQLTP